MPTPLDEPGAPVARTRVTLAEVPGLLRQGAVLVAAGRVALGATALAWPGGARNHALSQLALWMFGLVALARAMLYDPRWPWHAAAHLGAQVTAPPQYLRSQPRQYKDLFGA